MAPKLSHRSAGPGPGEGEVLSLQIQVRGPGLPGRRAGPDLSPHQLGEHLVDTTNGRKKSQKNKGAAFSH